MHRHTTHKLWHFRLCPHSRAVRMALDEFGIAVELVDVQPWAWGPELLALNPAGELPILRIAHGALMVGYMSAASTMVNALMAERLPEIFPVSLGYDKVRFLKPVFIGDTITVHYVVESIDAAKNRTLAKVEVSKGKGEIVAAAIHLMSWLPRQTS